MSVSQCDLRQCRARGRITRLKRENLGHDQKSVGGVWANAAKLRGELEAVKTQNAALLAALKPAAQSKRPPKA